MEDSSLLEQLITVGLPLVSTALVAVLAYALRKVGKAVKESENKVDDKILSASRKALREALDQTKEKVE